MSKFMSFLCLVLFSAVQVRAQAPSFEAALSGVHSEALASRRQRGQLSERIREAGIVVDQMAREVYDLPNFIFSLRQRSGNSRDPHLTTDVNRLLRVMGSVRQRTGASLAEVGKIRQLASKDQSLVLPAGDLARFSNNLASKMRLIEREMIKAEGSLRFAGFDAQVETIMQDTVGARGLSERLSSDTFDLYEFIVSKR